MARVMEPEHQWANPQFPDTWECAHEHEVGHTSLYVIFNGLDVPGEQVLYVGITGNVKRRFKQHAKSKPWFRTTENVSLECYDSWESACEAELSRIESFMPVHNIIGNELRRKIQADRNREIYCYVCGNLISPGTEEHEDSQGTTHPAHTRCGQVVVEAYEMGFTHGLPDEDPMRARALADWEGHSVLVQSR